jgi:exodeoxyribonuclease VIII
MTAPQNIRDNYEEGIPGVYSGVPNEEYHASEGISCSNIKDLDKSIEHFEHREAFDSKQTDAMLVGSALHDRVLLPDTYYKQYVVSPVKTKTSKAHNTFKKDNPDKDILMPYQENNIESMYRALYKNPTIRGILESDTILREVSVWGKDTTTGLLLKVRPDIIVGGICYDIKTTSGDVSPRGFISNVFKYKYQVQVPFYLDVLSLNGMSIHEFKFLVVGSVPPYSTAIYDLNEDLIEEGRDIYRRALNRYSDYLLGVDTWAGLVHGRETVTL